MRAEIRPIRRARCHVPIGDFEAEAENADLRRAGADSLQGKLIRIFVRVIVADRDCRRPQANGGGGKLDGETGRGSGCDCREWGDRYRKVVRGSS